MFVRPQPDQTEQKLLAKGDAVVAGGGVSALWFSNGGLEWDGQQLKVWDADGEAHPVPVPPNGVLVRTIFVAYEKGARYETPEMFVADQNKHRVARLPVDGFVDADLSELAAAAGLEWSHYTTSDTTRWGGYPPSDATIDLRKCTNSKTTGHGLGRLFHRHQDEPSSGAPAT